MLREGPRLPVVACETGDWSHVDVYLRRPPTSDCSSSPDRHVSRNSEWTTHRRSTVVGICGNVPERGTSCAIRATPTTTFRLLTEVIVPELVAARGVAGG
jgi:hypothetical protein